MRPDPQTFADEEGEYATAGGVVNNVNWAYENGSSTWAYLDAAGMGSLCFKPDHLREIADAVEEAAGTTESTESNTDDDTNHWDSSEDILLQNSTNTVGLAETTDAIKPLSTAAQSVLVTPRLLREALDVADGIGEKNAVWLTVQYDRPVVVTPRGERSGLSAVLTPRFTTDESTPPADLID